MIKKYNVTLEEQVVEEAKVIMEKSGRKLSPVINNLLKEWIEEQEKLKENNNLYLNHLKIF